MSLDSNALITLANLKSYLQDVAADNDTYDTILEMLINAASTLIQSEIGEPLVYTAYTEKYLTGNGTSLLRLPQAPIVAVTSVEEDDWEMTEGVEEDYVILYDAGYLRKTGGATWSKAVHNIKVSFTAGYYVASQTSTENEMPKDIQLACMKQVGIEWRRAKEEDWDQTSKTFPDGSIARNIIELHPQVKDICRKYKRPRV
jgi:hypothetical protein